jgi:DNA-binding CsgD family transcriptional regulator
MECATPVDPMLSLTKRERQLLYLVEIGLPNKLIAIRMGLRPGSAKQYVMRIMMKTGCINRVELAIKSYNFRTRHIHLYQFRDPPPKDLSAEPSYSGLETVIFCMRSPHLTMHPATLRCTVQGPHLTETCREWEQC